MSHQSDYSLLNIFFNTLNLLVSQNALQVEVRVRKMEFTQYAPFLD